MEVLDATRPNHRVSGAAGKSDLWGGCSASCGRSAERHRSRGEEGEKLQGKAPRRVHCSSSDQRRSAPWLEQRGLLSLQPPWLGVSQASPRSGASWALPEPTGSFSGCGQVHGNYGLRPGVQGWCLEGRSSPRQEQGRGRTRLGAQGEERHGGRCGGRGRDLRIGHGREGTKLTCRTREGEHRRLSFTHGESPLDLRV